MSQVLFVLTCKGKTVACAATVTAIKSKISDYPQADSVYQVTDGDYQKVHISQERWKKLRSKQV